MNQNVHFALSRYLIVASLIKAATRFLKVLGSHAAQSLNNVHVSKHLDLIVVQRRVTKIPIKNFMEIPFMFAGMVTMLAFLHFLSEDIDALLTAVDSLSVLATLKLAKGFVKKDYRTIPIALLNKDIVLGACLIIKTQRKEGNS